VDNFTLVFLLVTGLFLGLGAGFIMHRSDYCIAGMFRDLFLFRSLLKLRTLLLLMVSSMVLFELARQLGMLPLSKPTTGTAPTPFRKRLPTWVSRRK